MSEAVMEFPVVRAPLSLTEALEALVCDGAMSEREFAGLGRHRHTSRVGDVCDGVYVVVDLTEGSSESATVYNVFFGRSDSGDMCEYRKEGVVEARGALAALDAWLAALGDKAHVYRGMYDSINRVLAESAGDRVEWVSF